MGGAAAAQDAAPGACCAGAQAPIAGSPIVELKGKIARVRITPGEGMPFVEIKTASEPARVQLGSMRYLMTEGFNPKVGEDIVAKAYKLESGYVAINVSLPAQKKTLRLRDEQGRPLWRGGRNMP